jgi:hypothetical protein
MTPDVLSLLVIWLHSKMDPTFRPASWQLGDWAFTERLRALTFDPGCELVFERLHHEFF